MKRRDAEKVYSIHVRTQYSEDPGQPPPLPYRILRRTDLKYIYLFGMIYGVNSFFLIFKNGKYVYELCIKSATTPQFGKFAFLPRVYTLLRPI